MAYDFVNAWLAPESADYLVPSWGYGHGNATAMAAMDQATLTQFGLAPTEVPPLAQIPMDTAQHDRMLTEFEKIKSGF